MKKYLTVCIILLTLSLFSCSVCNAESDYIRNFNKKYTYVEVRYVDVYSSRLYSYIAENNNIKIGDIVYVDRAGTKCLAVVVNRAEYYYEQAPYPVLETKRVIKIVTSADEYKS